MPITDSPSSLIDTLEHEPPAAVVRVLVRPLEHPTAGTVTPVDPKAFASSTEYRSALIARQKERTRSGKDAVLAMAGALGLDASAAGALNAVVVEGEVAHVIQLLLEADIESACLEKDLGL